MTGWFTTCSADPRLGLTGSNVTEAALTKLLDDAGVPAVVPKYIRPGDRPQPDNAGPTTPAYFTF